MNKVINKLPALVDEELAAANAINGLFHSPHEGWAVLLEEVEEATQEMEAVRRLTQAAWEGVKLDSAEDVYDYAKDAEKRAVYLAAEAIQVSAMARKLALFASTQPFAAPMKRGGSSHEGG